MSPEEQKNRDALWLLDVLQCDRASERESPPTGKEHGGTDYYYSHCVTFIFCPHYYNVALLLPLLQEAADKIVTDI